MAQKHFETLKQAYPGRKLLVVSNTSGATSWDKDLKQAAEVEKGTGVHVLPHAVKKPGCGPEIMDYFKQHPETGVTDPSHIAVVGDRLTTDMMLANMMGGWGFWIKDGVVPLPQKSIVGPVVCVFLLWRSCSNMPFPASFQEWSATFHCSWLLEESSRRTPCVHSMNLEFDALPHRHACGKSEHASDVGDSTMAHVIFRLHRCGHCCVHSVVARLV